MPRVSKRANLLKDFE